MEEKIIKIAKKLFLDFGFKSVTMDDVANKIGISKKTIYKHFENKTHLVSACASIIFEEINSGVEKVCKEKQNPIDELYSIEEFVIEYLDEKDHTKSHQLKKFYPEIHYQLEKNWYKSLHGCMQENILRGKELKLYREDIDANFVIGIYFSGMLATCDGEIFLENCTQKALVFKFLEYHIRAISTKKGLNKLETILSK